MKKYTIRELERIITVQRDGKTVREVLVSSGAPPTQTWITKEYKESKGNPRLQNSITERDISEVHFQ